MKDYFSFPGRGYILKMFNIQVVQDIEGCGWSTTPRQVASRVQGYSEKLKLFGVKVEQA